MTVDRDPPDPSIDLNVRMLLVEDNMIIALDVEDMLTELGVEDVETARSVSEALEAIENGDFGVAILDVNLGSETSEEVAKALKEKGVPFVVATGYESHDDVRGMFGDAPAIIKKPYDGNALGQALRDALAESRR